jgi:hypothetical protein
MRVQIKLRPRWQRALMAPRTFWRFFRVHRHQPLGRRLLLAWCSTLFTVLHEPGGRGGAARPFSAY